MLVIDRFEGEFAVIETNYGMVNIPKDDIPKGSEEGDVLTLQIDKNETAQRVKTINKLMDNLFKD